VKRWERRRREKGFWEKYFKFVREDEVVMQLLGGK
jgi:hypothetical protein